MSISLHMLDSSLGRKESKVDSRPVTISMSVTIMIQVIDGCDLWTLGRMHRVRCSCTLSSRGAVEIYLSSGRCACAAHDSVHPSDGVLHDTDHQQIIVLIHLLPVSASISQHKMLLSMSSNLGLPGTHPMPQPQPCRGRTTGAWPCPHKPEHQGGIT